MPLDQTNWPNQTEVMDETTALLIRACAFLERGWCRYAQAKDVVGNQCDPSNEGAVEWCAWGALVAAGASQTDYDAPVYLQLGAVIGERIVNFNDAQETVEPILAAFDRAIAAARTGGT
jgi:hypothetical protein